MDRKERISRNKDDCVTSRPKRIRSYFSPAQTKKMEDVFAIDPFPDKDHIKQLSTLLDISERSLQVWFQNRRARQRKAHPEANDELIGLRSSRACYQYPTSIRYPFGQTPNPGLHILQDIKRKGEENIERISIDSKQNNVSSLQSSPTRTSKNDLTEAPLSWHRTQTDNPSKTPTQNPKRLSVDDNSDYLTPSPKRHRSIPVPHSEKYSTESSYKCFNLTDDYKSMQSNYHLYQQSLGSRNPFETPSPTYKSSSLLSLSPDDNTILNLCTRNSEKGFNSISPIAMSPEKTPPKPAPIPTPHWNPSIPYGYSPAFPPLPSQAVAHYYATLYHYQMSMEAKYGEMLKSQMTSFPGLPQPLQVSLQTKYDSSPESGKNFAESEKNYGL